MESELQNLAYSYNWMVYVNVLLCKCTYLINFSKLLINRVLYNAVLNCGIGNILKRLYWDSQVFRTELMFVDTWDLKLKYI